MSSKREFLLNDFPKIAKNLKSDQVPQFGVMTPQHMVEHITLLIKTAVKRYGEPLDPPSEGQQKFKKFIHKGAVMKHYPKEVTAADLPELRYGSFEEAMAQIPIAVKRFYDHFDTHPDYISYTKFAGELNFEELELLNYMHVRFHLWQFNLIESYP